VYICTHAHIYTYVFTSSQGNRIKKHYCKTTYLRIRKYEYMCIYMNYIYYVYIYKPTYIYVCAHEQLAISSKSILPHTLVSIPAHIKICAHMYIQTYIYVYIRPTCTYINMYTYVCTNVYICMYTSNHIARRPTCNKFGHMHIHIFAKNLHMHIYTCM